MKTKLLADRGGLPGKAPRVREVPCERAAVTEAIGRAVAVVAAVGGGCLTQEIRLGAKAALFVLGLPTTTAGETAAAVADLRRRVAVAAAENAHYAEAMAGRGQ